MLGFLITVDAESSKRVVNGKLLHSDFTLDVDLACRALSDIARKHAARLTFFYPLGEFADDRPKPAVTLGRELIAAGHELGLHRHDPNPLLDREEISSRLGQELVRFENWLSYRPISIRAGGYNTGDQAVWRNALIETGIRWDSSVWPGANTILSRGLADQARRREEDRWGPGALLYDYRGAPIAGVYPTTSESLTIPGADRNVLEVPIAVSWYEEQEPARYRLDLQLQPVDHILAALERLERWHDPESLLPVCLMFHSNGMLRRHGNGVTWTRDMHRVERLIAALARLFVHRGAGRFLVFRDMDPDAIPACFVYSPEQPEAHAPGRSWNDPEVSIQCPQCQTILIRDRDECPGCRAVYQYSDSIRLTAPPDFAPDTPPTASHTTGRGHAMRQWLRMVPWVRRSGRMLLRAAIWTRLCLESVLIVLLLVALAPLAIWRKAGRST